MSIQPKTFSDRTIIDEILEQAIEWQQRARQNHGLTIEVSLCIDLAIKQAQVTSMDNVSITLTEIIRLAQEDTNGHHVN